MAVQVNHSNGTLIIGFSGTFYCLWEVWPHWYTKEPMAHYIKKLSTDLEKAKAMAPRAIVDLDVYGQKWNISETPLEPMTEEEQIWARRDEGIFLFGKYNNMSIMECTDDSYIRWYWTETQSYVAEMALMKAGYRWLNDEWVSPEYFEKYINRLLVEKKLSEASNGHHEANGSRVTLNLWEIASFSFDGYFGQTNVITYLDDQGRVFKYMGSAWPDVTTREKPVKMVPQGDGIYKLVQTAPVEEYTTVKATISHDNYDGVDETKLKRISIPKK